jgi:UrcA family protein
MRRTILGAAVAALTPILLVSPASAGPRDVTVTARAPDPDQLQRRVSYRDLNLAAADGQRTLHQRVRRATAFVCNPLFSGGSFDRDYYNCRDNAWDGAEPQMALAIQRAKEIALAGSSSIPPVAIAVVARP